MPPKYQKLICGNKTRFPTVREAHRAIEKIKSNSDRAQIPHRTYYCDLCKHWHLSSKDKW